MKAKTSIIFYILLLFNTIISCSDKDNEQPSEDKQVGGRCEDCEIFYVDMPQNIPPHTILPMDQHGEALQISGRILLPDAVTPAPNVVLYLYQTNAQGYYMASTDQNSASRRHGAIRGWVKSDDEGKYSFITIKPGIYPDSTVPAHIHPIIKEESKSIYYLDDYVFEGEFKVDNNYIQRQELRGGSGIIPLTKDAEGIWKGERDIILGLNIPQYD